MSSFSGPPLSAGGTLLNSIEGSGVVFQAWHPLTKPQKTNATASAHHETPNPVPDGKYR
jgi:hypothetical protein